MGVLDSYGLRKEHLIEHLTELRTHLGQEDQFKFVDPKVKAAITREFNSGAHAPKVMLPTSKKRKAAAAAEDPDELDAEDGAPKELEEKDAESDDDTTAGGLIKIKANAKDKAKGKAKAKSGTSQAEDKGRAK